MKTRITSNDCRLISMAGDLSKGESNRPRKIPVLNFSFFCFKTKEQVKRNLMMLKLSVILDKKNRHRKTAPDYI
jgi:hypothetical protein